MWCGFCHSGSDIDERAKRRLNMGIKRMTYKLIQKKNWMKQTKGFLTTFPLTPYTIPRNYSNIVLRGLNLNTFSIYRIQRPHGFHQYRYRWRVEAPINVPRLDEQPSSTLKNEFSLIYSQLESRQENEGKRNLRDFIAFSSFGFTSWTNFNKTRK